MDERPGTPSDATPPAGARPRRWDVLDLAAWTALAIAYVSMLCVMFAPSDLHATSSAYLWLMWWAATCQSLLLQMGLAFTLIVLAAVWRRRWRFVVAALPLLAACYLPECEAYVARRPAPPTTGPTLRVMTLNLYRGEVGLPELLAEVARQRPDVLCLQEYNERWHAACSPALAAEFPYAAARPTRGTRGLAVYSRRPFVGTPTTLPFEPERGPQLRAALEFDGRTCVIYGIHMVQPAKGRRMRYQNAQFATLLALLAHERDPVILCGDFNFTPRSAYDRMLRGRGFVDANLACGAGRAASWPSFGLGHVLLGIRIDHIYLSPELACTAATVGQAVGSDHYPVVADICIAPAAGALLAH